MTGKEEEKVLVLGMGVMEEVSLEQKSLSAEHPFFVISVYENAGIREKS